MATINDKINLFQSILTERAEGQVKDRRAKALQGINEQFAAEQERILQHAEQAAEERILRAESNRVQIISKARMDSRRQIFLKKEEILNCVMDDLLDKLHEFVKTTRYEEYLMDSICKALQSIGEDEQLAFYFTPEDLEQKKAFIHSTIQKYASLDLKYTLQEAEEDIIGGCVCRNEQGTKKADGSLKARLDDSREFIGSLVMEQLQ